MQNRCKTFCKFPLEPFGGFRFQMATGCLIYQDFSDEKKLSRSESICCLTFLGTKFQLYLKVLSQFFEFKLSCSVVSFWILASFFLSLPFAEPPGLTGRWVNQLTARRVRTFYHKFYLDFNKFINNYLPKCYLQRFTYNDRWMIQRLATITNFELLKT